MERLDTFMARANAAYYANRDPFKDFTTAPEISQAFGEVLGAWAVVTWTQMGRPNPVLLAECGPGRGTLMADALRAIGQVAPDFRDALQLHLVETSPRLRAVQAQRLSATFHAGPDTLPPGPLILIANEFLDALPIRQFVRRGGGWTERYVHNGEFVEQPAPPPPRNAEESEIVETCAPAEVLVAALGHWVAEQGGAALFLDYGPQDSAPGDSLQALRNGAPADPLEGEGAADLTAHVDFAALARVARDAGARVLGPIPQGAFLTRLGLFQRSHKLARSQPPARAVGLIQAAQRLAEPTLMGRLFKVMAICDPTLPTLAGFEP